MLQKNKKVIILSDEEIKCTRWKECKAKITYAMFKTRCCRDDFEKCWYYISASAKKTPREWNELNKEINKLDREEV
jgi:hypothetical protein